MTEASGKSDMEASTEAWNKHLLRNDSVIVDLFHGQYKSTIVCSVCNKISITFDPFMTISLPLPGRKVNAGFYLIKYNLDVEDYTNFKGEVKLKETDTVQSLRHVVGEKMDMDMGSFLVTHVENNRILRMFGQSAKIEDVKTGKSHILLYEIDPTLGPNLKSLKA